MHGMLLKVKKIIFEKQNLKQLSADFVTIYVGVNRFLLNTNITIDQFMHYVDQAGLSLELIVHAPLYFKPFSTIVSL